MIQRIRHIARANDFILYEKPYQLNIWGIRSPNTHANAFDDELHVFTKIPVDNGKLAWLYRIYKCTTDPGTFWLENPMHPQGTAMLKAGQYVDAYKLALHRGKYKALCQRLGKVVVVRDYNRDSILDFYNGVEDIGMFGINIHRARKTGETLQVDNHSAGCQVLKNAADFADFIGLCELHEQHHGNVFTYTLIDKRAEQRAFRKKIATIATVGLVAGAILLSPDKQQTIPNAKAA